MTAPVRDVAWVGNLIHPRGSKERLTLVLKAYFDASGKHKDPKTPVIAVAGFVGGETQWKVFEDHWGRFLKKHGLEVDGFHAAPFWSRKGKPYRDWDDTKHSEAVQDLCAVFEAVNPMGFGWAVDKEVFSEWRDNFNPSTDPNPYYYCLDLCLRALIHGVAQVPKDEGIAIYIDQDKEYETIGTQLAKWHETRLRQTRSKNVDRNRPVSTHYVSRIQFRPLQAADTLVHANYQSLRDFMAVARKAPKIAPPPGSLCFNEPYFMRRMKDKNVPVHVNMFHSLEHFSFAQDIHNRRAMG